MPVKVHASTNSYSPPALTSRLRASTMAGDAGGLPGPARSYIKVARLWGALWGSPRVCSCEMLCSSHYFGVATSSDCSDCSDIDARLLCCAVEPAGVLLASPHRFIYMVEACGGGNGADVHKDNYINGPRGESKNLTEAVIGLPAAAFLQVAQGALHSSTLAVPTSVVGRPRAGYSQGHHLRKVHRTRKTRRFKQLCT